MKERLQKVLARAGIASRRAAERLILEGRVQVDGVQVTRLGVQVDPAQEAIRVNGRRLPPAPPDFVYLALNKPRGYVTTLRDPEGRPTVRDLLAGVRGRVYPVGRLDYQSEGLLLLTNDGELAAALMHPRHAVTKTYLAKVRGRPSDSELRRLEAGVSLDGIRTLPAKLELTRAGANSWVEVTLREGKKHQVRRMLEKIGHPVQRLRRIRYGGVGLKGLRSGSYRALDASEIALLRKAAGVTRSRRSPAADGT